MSKYQKRHTVPEQKTIDRVELVKNFLTENYIIRVNEFDTTNSYIECKDKKRYAEPPSVDDISLHLESAGIRGCDGILKKILNSKNQIETFNPIIEYFDGLKNKWKGVSHIDLLCSCIKVRDFGDKEENFYQNRFHYIFKKWLVACIANTYRAKANDVILGFLSFQTGIGKTSLTENILPDELKIYYQKTDKNEKYFDINKAFRSKFLINFDELEGIKKSNISTLKKTLSDLKIISKDGNYLVPRIANAILTSNQTYEYGGFMYELMNDRRFGMVELESIDYNKYNKDVNVEQIWAEAITLFQSTTFDYVWNRNDYDDFIDYNRRYEKETDALKLIRQYYNVPRDEDTNAVFMTATDIIRELQKHRKINASINVSDRTIGRALNYMGYKRVMSKTDNNLFGVYGYNVISLLEQVNNKEQKKGLSCIIDEKEQAENLQKLKLNNQ